jgi:hypothetical protein
MNSQIAFNVQVNSAGVIDILSSAKDYLLSTVIPAKYASGADKFSDAKLLQIIALYKDNYDENALNQYDALYYIFKAFFDNVLMQNWQISKITSSNGTSLKYINTDNYTVTLKDNSYTTAIVYFTTKQ